ncbi:MAG: hypothetical protein Kow0029_07280 [Candidatus Rifleibacteriota bacterium]
MKLFSTTSLNGLFSGQPVKAELVAKADGKSLVMLNGMPVQVDGDYKDGRSIEAILKEKGIAIRFHDAASGADAEKMLDVAGLEKSEENIQLVKKLREYGVFLNSENLKNAVVLLQGMPGQKPDKLNVAVIALLLLKKLPNQAEPLVRDYLSGKLRFASIFAGFGKELLEQYRGKMGFLNMLEHLKQLLEARSKTQIFADSRKTGSFEKLVSSLEFQELLSIKSSQTDENRFFFQWPIFWANQDLPDTLEGEAFFPDSAGEKKGFCLRLLVCPPNLGQTEISMNNLDNMLWIHFGAQAEAVEQIRGIFPVLFEKLKEAGFEEVRLTIGKIRRLENFFLARSTDETRLKTKKRIDLKV